MHTLPPALAGLAEYPQFILYRLIRDGAKLVKKPIDWRTGHTHDPTDPAAHTTAANALAAVAAGKADGIGFVFTDADPFFFLDIDHALQPNGQWSDLAQRLCAAFPGAAVEVSASGHGLHIIGTGIPPAHGCDNDALQIQFYHRARFVALTGTHAMGDVRADMSAVLPWLVEHYFQVRAPAAPLAVEGGPRSDWRGPLDDEDLIRRALRSSSMAGKLGTSATFAELWDGDEAALARVFPSATDTYNRSQADAALAAHLAFWTGCDVPRMARIMRRSGLARDKWDERDDYLEGRTLPRIAALQRDVCRDREIEAPALAEQPVSEMPAAAPRTGSTFLSPGDQIEYFKGCVYVQDQHKVLVPGGVLLKEGQFRATYGGRCFVLEPGNEKTTRNAWEAFTESQAVAFPRASSSWFRPDLLPGGIMAYEGLTFVNTYVKLDIPTAPGDPSRFLNHLAILLPDERDRQILLAYMAALVQYPGVKFQWAPLIQGVEGNGKSFLSRCVSYAVGERYTHWPRADQISAKFNSWLSGKLFVAVEDAYTPDDHGELFEILKPMITSSRQPVEPKGVDQFSTWVWANFIFNTNIKGALKKTRNDRRIAPFYCAQQEAMDLRRDGIAGGYMPALYRWLYAEGGAATVAHFLRSYVIPDEFNPAKDCQRAPTTSVTEAAIEDSVGGIEQEVLEAIGAGLPGFCGGWVSSRMLDALLVRLNRSRSMTHRKRDKMLNDLGFIRHPGLADGGRTNNPVAPDATKTVLYVRPGTDEARIEGAAAIARAYSEAQVPG